ncbi:MAG: DNA polymerase I, partial [Spirochaetaceae bacterium]|nr:DNA polymerase I [Spirochaetaceae bacterium]
MNNTLYILDGYALIYRAYFAFIHRPLTDRDGNNVSAVHGFFRTLFALRRSHDAEKIAVALDPAGPTFRHETYPEYKANRDPAPEELHAQVPIIREILKLLGIPVFLIDRYEADDVIGTVAEICRKQQRSCRLVSSDKDLMQLVDDDIRLLRPEKGGGFLEMGPAEILEEKGVRPDQIIDYLALIGDASDNIPGVAGIGPKTASALLAEWDNLDSLYENIDSAAKGARLIKLIDGKENAYFSQALVTIKTDLPLDDELAAMDGLSADPLAAAKMFRERDLRTLAAEAEALTGTLKPVLEQGSEQTSPEVGKVIYIPILNESEMKEWGGRIREAGIVALDTETDSLDPMRAELVGLSVSVKAGEAAYLPVKRPDGSCIPLSGVVEWLNGLLAGGGIRIIGQNFKYDMKVLRRMGVGIGGSWFDTMIAAWVLDASSPVGMDALADRYLGLSTVKFKDVVPKGSTFDAVPLDEAVRYAAEDADITLR